MEFLFSFTGNEVQMPTKTKLAKLRHLDLLFLLLLVVAIVFFLIFQNQSLRDELKVQFNEEVFQEIVNQKVAVVMKELDEIKQSMVEEKSRLQARDDQLKTLIKALSKQLGMPPPDQPYTNNQPQREEPTYSTKNYEIYEVIQRKEILQAEFQKEMDETTDHPDSKSIISILRAVESNQSESSKTTNQETCDYLLSVFPSLEQPRKREENLEWEIRRANFSAFTQSLPKQKGNVEELLQELKQCSIWIGNCVLVVGLGLGLLMLLSYMVNRQKRAKQSLFKWMLKFLGTESKKRSLKEKDQPLCL